MKYDKAYSNQALLDALKNRDELYNTIINETSNGYIYDDKQQRRIKRIKSLTQFQKDLLYLSSQMSVYKVAELYGVSARYLYNHLKLIDDILK